MTAERIQIENLDLQSVDPDGDAPLYLQIEADLRRLIRSGALSTGVLMPTEVALAEAYGVGRQTVRMALSRLVADDLIARQAGRGTVVKPQEGRRHFYLDRSFTRQMTEMGLEPHAKVLQAAVRQVDPSLAPVFHPYLGEPYLQLTRLRFGGDQPVGLQTARVLLTRCPGLEGYDFSQKSLYEILSRDYSLPVDQITHTIGAALADELQSALLQVGRGAPLLVVTTHAYLAGEELIEESVSYYRADRYEYTTSHHYRKK